MADRDVHLLLSPKAAAVLSFGIDELLADSRMTDEYEAIYLAIKRDLNDQLPREGKIKKKVIKKAKK